MLVRGIKGGIGYRYDVLKAYVGYVGYVGV